MIVKFRGPHKHRIELSGVQCIAHGVLYDSVIVFHEKHYYEEAKIKMNITAIEDFRNEVLKIYIDGSSTIGRGYKIGGRRYTYFDVEEE